MKIDIAKSGKRYPVEMPDLGDEIQLTAKVVSLTEHESGDHFYGLHLGRERFQMSDAALAYALGRQIIPDPIDQDELPGVND